MKINRINHVESKQYKSKRAVNSTNITSPIVSSNSKENLHAGLLGRSLVSFSGHLIEQSNAEKVNPDYFQLPPGCAPDEYQLKAAQYLHQGKDVLVSAPTGTGKTAIAQYIISKNLEEGKRTFYTTPLKALSNQKLNQLEELYKGFQSKYGEKNVGIITGDMKINPDAKVVVMTTEIYNNMLGGPEKAISKTPESTQLKNLGTVIYDELHYMGDLDRGGVWEQSIMKSGKTQLLSLSATIGNSQEVADWMSKVKQRPTALVDVPASKRHVPLKFHNDKVYKYDPKAPFAAQEKLVQELKAKNELTSAFFVYSKRKIQQMLDSFKTKAQVDRNYVLTTKDEQSKIKEIVKKYKDKNIYLGEGLDLEALKYGYAPHHSGLLPAQKELIEELGQGNLVKVILTTETLGAGINFPIRSAVMTSTRKPVSLKKLADAEDGKRRLSVNEFHQQAGRAGRRGLDIRGDVYTIPETKDEQKVFATLIESTPDSLKSHYSPAFSDITKYHRETSDTSAIKDYFKNSFMAYSKNQDITNQNSEKMFNTFKQKRDILKQFGFVSKDNSLTPKGALLAELNGFTQIPIVELVFNKQLPTKQLIDFTAGVASMSSISESVAEKAKRQLEYEQKHRKNNSNGSANTSIQKAKAAFELESPELNKFVTNLENYLFSYNGKMKNTDSSFENVAHDKELTSRLYEWAKLNTNSQDSIKNWQTMFEANVGKVDEGGMFSDIYRTTNLLKQIKKIADTAVKLPELIEDLDYYKTVGNLAQESIKLVQKKSIFMNIV